MSQQRAPRRFDERWRDADSIAASGSKLALTAGFPAPGAPDTTITPELPVAASNRRSMPKLHRQGF